MPSIATKIFRRVKRPFTDNLEKTTEDNHFLTGQMVAMKVRRIQQVRFLSDVEFRVWSQWGEDGIIEWLVERLGISVHSFVEFGVEDYREANTRFLLANRNWRGLVIDGCPRYVNAIKADKLYWKHDLSAICAFIDRENINDVIATKFKGEIGILSVDIDGNDYWVLERISVVNPILLICEYNAVFGDLAPITIPYDPTFYRTRAHRSNLYYGASLAAIRSLAARKGYSFVGTNTAGSNAFFVRNDFSAKLQAAIENAIARPSKFRESRDQTGKLTYVTGLDRMRVIKELPVVNVETGQTLPLASVQPLFSPHWLAEIGDNPPV